jgi:hypothetical protein
LALEFSIENVWRVNVNAASNQFQSLCDSLAGVAAEARSHDSLSQKVIDAARRLSTTVTDSQPAEQAIA